MHVASVTAMLAIALLIVAQLVYAQTAFEFTSALQEADSSAGPNDTPFEIPSDGITPFIPEPEFPVQGSMFFQCGCVNDKYEFEPVDPNKLRRLSNQYLTDNRASASRGWSNLVWGWGQFVAHMFAATLDDFEGETFDTRLKDGPDSATMTLRRVVAEPSGPGGKCRAPQNLIKPVLDANVVYGYAPSYLKNVLRESKGCRMRTSAGDFLPVTSAPLRGLHRFVAGDGRANEHAILTGLHTVWLREHNRVCDQVEGDKQYKGLSDDAKFELTRKVVEAKMQQITVNDWLPKLGITAEEVQAVKPLGATGTDVAAEFFTVFRFGHDLVPDSFGEFDVIDVFGGEKFFGVDGPLGVSDAKSANGKLGSVLHAAATSVCFELDAHFSDVLRNFLFGTVLQDLATRNMFRSSEIGLASYDKLASCYGVKPIQAVSKLVQPPPRDNPLFALLQESGTVTAPFGPVVKAIIVDQLHRSLFGPGGLWWEDNEAAVAGFEDEIKSTTLGKVLEDTLGTSFPADVFLAGQ